MEKAYDIKDLGLKLKSKGLDLAEEASKIVVDSVLDWFEESAKLSATPYDDMALIVLPQIKIFIAAQLDRIDGQVG